MNTFALWFFALLCSWGVWEFGSLLWKMLKTRQFEDADGTPVKASEQPASFRLSVYLGAAIVIAAATGAVWAWVEALGRLR